MERQCANIRTMKYLLDGYKDIMVSQSKKMSGAIFMARTFMQLIEDFKSVYSIDVEKISPRKWQVISVSTEENSYNLEDDNLFLSPANYNLKRLTEQVEIYQYNSFFGVRLEFVCKGELELFPELFKITNEKDEEITQDELKKLA